MEKNWFEGSCLIGCSFQSLKHLIENHGTFYEGVVSCMSGISGVELLEQGEDYLIIETNEGVMKRRNLKKSIEQDFVVIEFDEEYKAGKMVTTRSHFIDEYTSHEEGIILMTTIRDVKASGILGLIYRIFGSKNIGKAVLDSHKTYLEAL